MMWVLNQSFFAVSFFFALNKNQNFHKIDLSTSKKVFNSVIAHPVAMNIDRPGQTLCVAVNLKDD